MNDIQGHANKYKFVPCDKISIWMTKPQVQCLLALVLVVAVSIALSYTFNSVIAEPAISKDPNLKVELVAQISQPSTSMVSTSLQISSSQTPYSFLFGEKPDRKDNAVYQGQDRRV